MANLYDKAGLVNIPVGYQDGFLYNIKPEDNTLGFRFNRDSAATRVNKEGLIEQVGYFGPELVQNGDFSQLGPELVVNGDFATDSDWIKEAGWSIANNKATGASTTGRLSATSSGLVELGKTYRTEYEIKDYVSGSIRIELNGNNDVGTTRSGNGVYVEYITILGSQSDLRVVFDGIAAFTGSIDNVSVKQVDPNDYWNLGNGWVIENGVATCTELNNNLTQDVGVSAGKSYKVTLDVTEYTSGTLAIDIGGSSNQTTSSVGSKTFYFQTSSTGHLRFYGGSFRGSIDNISVVEVLGDKPRIDYTDSLTSPSFLLEPQSTNLSPYSEDFSQWGLGDVQILSATHTNPDGTTSAKVLAYNGGTNQHYMSFSPSVSSGQDYTFSIFVKAKELKYVCLVFLNDVAGRYFDLENGTLLGSQFSVPSNSKIEDFGNGWYRCSITDSATSTTKFSGVYLSQDGTSIGPYIPGTNTDGLYVWGAQIEQLPYATSYIPTLGSTVTRAQETCVDAGNASTFNSSEGVLYAEIAALTDLGSYRLISLNSNNSSSNRITIAYDNVDNQIYGQCVAGGTSQALFTTQPTSISDFHKIALKYKANDLAFWVDGVEVGTDTSASIPTNLNTLSFDRADAAAFFYGKTKGIYVFNEALTDDELQQLTGPEYNSFAALAAAYNYTVI